MAAPSGVSFALPEKVEVLKKDYQGVLNALKGELHSVGQPTIEPDAQRRLEGSLDKFNTTCDDLFIQLSRASQLKAAAQPAQPAKTAAGVGEGHRAELEKFREFLRP